MNSKIYRCGWCGYPTDKEGEILRGEAFEKAKNIINAYGGKQHTHLVNGECCPNGNYPLEPNRIRVTRDMAIDAGDLSLEGQII